MMIKASGRFKETQRNYFIAAIINLLVSIITVKLMGLIGVAIAVQMHREVSQHGSAIKQMSMHGR